MLTTRLPDACRIGSLSFFFRQPQFIRISRKTAPELSGAYFCLRMSTVAEIKSKYGLANDGAVAISVDVEALRETANRLLEDAQSVQRDMASTSDKEWTTRRKQRVAALIKEQKRSVDMARKFLDEVGTILDNASETLKKAK